MTARRNLSHPCATIGTSKPSARKQPPQHPTSTQNQGIVVMSTKSPIIGALEIGTATIKVAIGHLRWRPIDHSRACGMSIRRHLQGHHRQFRRCKGMHPARDPGRRCLWSASAPWWAALLRHCAPARSVLQHRARPFSLQRPGSTRHCRLSKVNQYCRQN